jgi:methylenetetrahydrofolate reductase (NAD(P)H)
MENIREYLKNNVLLFDGAMGTYYDELTDDGIGCELANIKNSELIRGIHKEYIEAGAKAILTNTFATGIDAFLGDRDLQKKVINAGIDIAIEAAKEEAYVFADMGSLSADSNNAVFEEYKIIADIFLEKGIKNFFFETRNSTIGLKSIGEYIKEKSPDSFIIVSFAVMPDGYSSEGYYYKTMFKEICESGFFDAVGLNCMTGANHMAKLLKDVNTEGLYLVAMPNAGYPIVRDNRIYYGSLANYFATQIEDILDMGVNIVGGCCGTTPKHIELLKKSMRGKLIKPRRAIKHEKGITQNIRLNRFKNKLESGQKAIAVELDSPIDTNVNKFMENAKKLKLAGADIVTIADNPIARARMDSCLLACKVRNELDFDVLPHMTCRDRNVNAAKGLLLGASAFGVDNVLVITGDPIPNAQRDEIRSVFEFNSVKFANFIKSLNDEVFESPMNICAALNVNSRNFSAELKKAKRKQENGVEVLFTQPVLTKRAVENLKTARENLDIKIMGGIIPIVSERNARYMQSEVNGIYITDDIVEKYIGKEREDAEEIALSMSKEIANEIYDLVDGYYLITVLNRVSLMEKLIKTVKEVCENR